MQTSFSDRALEGYGLTTVRIVYRMPDNLSMLQEFLWQKYDLFPTFPEVQKFLDFWDREIEGPLYSVTVAHARLIRPTELGALRSVTRH